MRARSRRPHWCFLPTGELCRLTGRAREASLEIGANLNAIAALAGWRVTQGIYRFDPALFDSVWQTPLNTRIPWEVLFRLPEWCVYIMTPGYVFASRNVSGFFAYLDYEAGSGRSELRMLLDVGEDRLLSALPIDLGGRSLLDGLESSRERFRDLLTGAGKPTDLADIAATDMRQYAGELGPLVNLLLYICSVNAETFDASGRGPRWPSPKITRWGPRLFPPDKPTEWQVGYRMGAALREAASRSVERWAHDAVGRRRPRPHIRRAHWHSYWMGPANSAEHRRLSVKWIPPVAVCVEMDRQPVTVVRTVTDGNAPVKPRPKEAR